VLTTPSSNLVVSQIGLMLGQNHVTHENIGTHPEFPPYGLSSGYTAPYEECLEQGQISLAPLINAMSTPVNPQGPIPIMLNAHSTGPNTAGPTIFTGLP